MSGEHLLTFRVMRLTAATPSRRPSLPFVTSPALQPTASQTTHDPATTSHATDKNTSRPPEDSRTDAPRSPTESSVSLQTDRLANISLEDPSNAPHANTADPALAQDSIRQSDVAPTERASIDNAQKNLTENIPVWEGEGAPASVGTVSILPASFGSIYASETFRSLISTYNQSESTVQAVAVTIEMTTASQRRISLVTTRPAINVPPSETLSHVVTVPLPELGVHVLVCTATYQDSNGSVRTLRQLFRFNVLPPLEPFVNVVALRRYHGNSDLSDDASLSDVTAIPPPSPSLAQFIVDLRVLNTMPVPVYVSYANLNANSEYTIVEPMLRKDDPAAPIGQAPTATQLSSMAETNSLDSPSKSCVVPPRDATTGVGDTRNFLFYVARPLDPSEQPDTPGGTHTKDGHDVPRSRTTERSPGREGPLLHRTDLLNTRKSADLRAGVGLSARSVSPASDESDRGKRAGTWAHDGEPSPKRPAASPSVVTSTRREIGYFSLQWHSGTGEYGRMDNVIAAFEPTSKIAPIELRIAAVPQDIRVQTPFAARCVARNNTERVVRLYLQVRRDLVGEIVPVGISGVSLGEVAPEASVDCLLTLIALARGQHSISGVRVVDIESRQSFNADAPVVSVL